MFSGNDSYASHIKEDLKNAYTSQGTTPHRTHRLATRGGIGRQRRHRFDSEPGAWGGSCACDSQQHIGRGIAGLVAGAMSMAAGEYVSVHSQADTEQAELQRERTELKADDKGEHEELMEIYIGRGLDPSLAASVQLPACSAGASAGSGVTRILSTRWPSISTTSNRNPPHVK